jgi:hypothetical protein
VAVEREREGRGAPRENEAFDYSAIPKRFYFEVETVGSVSPQEVVLKVRVASERNTCIPEPKLISIYRGLQNCKRQSDSRRSVDFGYAEHRGC